MMNPDNLFPFSLVPSPHQPFPCHLFSPLIVATSFLYPSLTFQLLFSASFFSYSSYSSSPLWSLPPSISFYSFLLILFLLTTLKPFICQFLYFFSSSFPLDSLLNLFLFNFVPVLPFAIFQTLSYHSFYAPLPPLCSLSSPLFCLFYYSLLPPLLTFFTTIPNLSLPFALLLLTTIFHLTIPPHRKHNLISHPSTLTSSYTLT